MIIFINILMFLSIIPCVLALCWAFSGGRRSTRELGWVGRVWVITSLVVIIGWGVVAAFLCIGQLEMIVAWKHVSKEITSVTEGDVLWRSLFFDVVPH